eukprot:6710969-Pyramimonas_sp.AAC.1
MVPNSALQLRVAPNSAHIWRPRATHGTRQRHVMGSCVMCALRATGRAGGSASSKHTVGSDW